MLAYHNDPTVKRRYLDRVRRHRLADQLIQGTGWADGRGCAVGCTLRAYDHDRYPVELGVPVELAHLEDAIFEGLPIKLAQQWPERFLRAIPVGADLGLVWSQWALWLLREELDPHHTTVTRPAVAAVCALFDRRIAGTEPAREKWSAARDAAYDAAADAAALAASRAAASAAWAAWAAAAASRAAWEVSSAAWAARRATAAASAAPAWKRMADALISALANAP